MIAFKPICYADESPASFLTRVSHEIGHDSVIDMIRARSEVKCYRDLSAVLSMPQRNKQLMCAIGIKEGYPSPAAESPGIGYQYRLFEGFKLIFSLLRGDLAAFCPECLRSQAYWKKRWTLRMYTVCEKHGCELLDRCQKCNLSLSVERGSIHLCPACDFDFRKSKSQRVSNPTKRIVADLFGEVICPEKFNLMLSLFLSINDTFKNSTTDAKRMDLARLIIEAPSQAESQLHKLLTETTLNTHPRIQCLPLLMNRNSAPIAEAALEKLGVISLRESKSWEPYYLNLSETSVALNVSLQVVKKFLKWNILSYVGDNRVKRIPSSMLTNLLDKKPGQLKNLIDKASGNGEGERCHVSCKEAAKILGTTETVVWGLVKAKHLKSSVHMVGGHKRNTFEKASIEHFKRNYMLSRVIADRFDVPKQNVSQRLRTLKIYPVSGPSINGALTNVFKISDLRHLTKSKVHAAKICSVKSIGLTRTAIDEKDYITMKSAAKFLDIGMRAVTKLTQRGILNRVDLPHRNVLIEKKSVSKLMKKINDPKYFRLQDIRDKTALPPTVFWHFFINAGIVKIVQLFSWQLVHERCVRKLDALLLQYVTETEGNRMLGKGSGRLTSLRKKGEIEFKRFRGRSRDVYFYSKEGIENLIKAEATGP